MPPCLLDGRDGNSTGPFGDFWHTKEGTSRGNEGGPWYAAASVILHVSRGKRDPNAYELPVIIIVTVIYPEAVESCRLDL